MLLVENSQIVSGFVPIDLQTGANDGDWISLKNYNHIALILFKAVGTAGDDPTLTIEQATDVAGAGAKALDFVHIYTKQAALLTSVGQFTKVTQAAANTYTDLTSAELQAIWVIEFNGIDLDVANGFDCLRGRVADIGGNAQLGAMLYVLSEARHGVDAPGMPSAIVD